jgi:hypothetical protein
MYYGLITGGLFLLVALGTGCKKNTHAPENCFEDATTVRQITDKQARMVQSGEEFYIVEQGTIDTRLNPCNLAPAFRVNDMEVTVSGDVKATVRSSNSPCCTDDFVITSISR